MSKIKLSLLFSRLGLLVVARLLNNGHWYGLDDITIRCRFCNLESAYWGEQRCFPMVSFSLFRNRLKDHEVIMTLWLGDWSLQVGVDYARVRVVHAFTHQM